MFLYSCAMFKLNKIKKTTELNVKCSATITAPITVKLSRNGELGKVTFVSYDVDTALMNGNYGNQCVLGT